MMVCVHPSDHYYVGVTWPGDPADGAGRGRLCEIGEPDLRFLERRHAFGAGTTLDGRRFAYFDRDDLEPLLEEIDG